MEADVSLRVLVVEPDDARYAALREALDAPTSLHVRATRARTVQGAYEALRAGRVDVCLAPSKEGTDASAALTLRLARADTFVPVIAVADSRAAGVEALRFEGAADYLLRDRLTPEAVERALWVAQARREAVEAFRHEQEVFTAALRDADLAVVELGPDGRVVRLSALAAEALCLEARDVLGRPYTLCFAAEQHDALADLLAGRTAHSLSFRTTAEEREVEWTFSPLHRGGAVGVGQFGASGGFRESDVHGVLRHVSDALPMVVYATDAEGRFTYVDGSALDAFDIVGADLVGEVVFEIYGHQAERMGYVRDALSGQPTDVLLEVRDRQFRARYLPLLGDDDRVAGMVMVAYDASAEAAAERRFRQLAAAIDAVEDPIGLADVSGAAVYINRAMADRFGYTLDELNAAGGPAAVYRDAAVATEVFDAIRAGEPWEGEVDFVTRHGESVRAHLRARAVYSDEGELIGLVGVHHVLG